MNRVVLFGVCEIGLFIKENMKVKDDVEIVFCDNDVNKQGKEYHGILVVSPELVYEWNSNNLLSKVIIVAKAYDSILEQCIMNNIAIEKVYFYQDKENVICEGRYIFSQDIFSQDGEEIYLKNRFVNKQKGFYVDIGANHPLRFSNTQWAYQKGWNGINVEPDDKCYNLLKKLRKRDINLNCGIAEIDDEREYYVFEENALNTFDKDEAEEIVSSGKYGSYKIRKQKCIRLQTLFDEYNVLHVDFLDIDVEGMEWLVLQSINWSKVSIDVILLEQRNLNLEDVLKTEIYNFLRNKGYKATNKYNRTVVYEKV